MQNTKVPSPPPLPPSPLIMCYVCGQDISLLLASQGMRPDQGIPKVTVLLTDGYSNGRGVSGPANQLRNHGVNIFSIGVGYNVNPAELNTIASDPDSTHVFRMSSFNDLSGWVDKLSAVSCDGKLRGNSSIL